MAFHHDHLAWLIDHLESPRHGETKAQLRMIKDVLFDEAVARILAEHGGFVGERCTIELAARDRSARIRVLDFLRELPSVVWSARPCTGARLIDPRDHRRVDLRIRIGLRGRVIPRFVSRQTAN